MAAARNAILVIALIALALVAFRPSVAALWALWASNRYVDGHGPFIALTSLVLLVRSRDAFAAADLQPSAAGAAGLLAGGLAWVIAWWSGIGDLHVMLLPLVLFVATWAAFGRATARIAAFPIGFLYFAEPLWHVLISPLQELTIRVVGMVAPVLGMPVRIAGTVLDFPNGISFEVTPICSGVNFLVVGLAVAVLIGELQGAPLRRRTALVAWMAFLMVLSNWVRVLVIIIAGYTTGMRSVLATRGHWYLGWALFALVVFGFALWSGRGSPHPARPSPVGNPGQ